MPHKSFIDRLQDAARKTEEETQKGMHTAEEALTSAKNKMDEEGQAMRRRFIDTYDDET